MSPIAWKAVQFPATGEFSLMHALIVRPNEGSDEIIEVSHNKEKLYVQTK
jgi:hypothetical protein